MSRHQESAQGHDINVMTYNLAGQSQSVSLRNYACNRSGVKKVIGWGGRGGLGGVRTWERG